MDFKTRQENLKKINDLIKGIKTAMLVSVDEQGNLHSRPMVTQEAEFNGTIWFFTETGTEKALEVRQNPHVNVTYVGDNSFVSVTGQAEVVQDLSRKKELWSEPLRIWFKDGPESPNVALLRIDAHSVEYWDAPSGGVIGSAVAAVRVLLGGEPEDAGENERVRL